MKVTAFIRKTSAKNNVTDLARVYFRVRDIGGVDIKAASELSIRRSASIVSGQVWSSNCRSVSTIRSCALLSASSVWRMRSACSAHCGIFM